MEAYFLEEARIQEWIDQIVEKLFTVCLLSGQDAETEFQRGRQVIQKITTLLRGASLHDVDELRDGLRQLLVQRLPDTRVIDNFPMFYEVMDRMIDDGVMAVLSCTSEEIKGEGESVNAALLTEHPVGIPSSKVVLSAGRDVAPAAGQGSSHVSLRRYHELVHEANNSKRKDEVSASIAQSITTGSGCILQPAVEAMASVIGVNSVEVIADLIAVDKDINTLEQTKPSAKTESQTIAQAKPEMSKIGMPDVTKPKTGVQRSWQVLPEAERLNATLRLLYPDASIRWNLSLRKYTFLAQVGELLIYLDTQNDGAKIISEMQEEGWIVLVCTVEDLAFPRRIERAIRQLWRSNRLAK